MNDGVCEIVGVAGGDGRKWWVGAAIVILAVVVLNQARLWRPGVVFAGGHNVQIAEARAWWEGRLNLGPAGRDSAGRPHDTAVSDGRIYSHFPLLFTIVAAGLVPLYGGVPHWFMVGLALTVPLLAYRLFRRLGGSQSFGAILALAYVCGTSAWPVLDRTIRTGSPYYVNTVLANIGLFVLLTEYVGRRRPWIAAAGLVISSLSRQLSLAFAIPFAWMVVTGSGAGTRRSSLMALAVGVLSVGTVSVAANAMKFGHPLETGYKLIYEGRDDAFAEDAKTHGLLGGHFLLRNLYYANVGLPRLHRITMAGRDEVHLQPNTQCTGIWWTTPLLVWLFVDIRRILSEPDSRWLLAACGAVFVTLLFFHATGAYQRGYNRFSLDYMPALFTIVAPRCFEGRRRRVSMAMIVWSVLYFRLLIQPGSIRVPFLS